MQYLFQYAITTIEGLALCYIVQTLVMTTHMHPASIQMHYSAINHRSIYSRSSF